MRELLKEAQNDNHIDVEFSPPILLQCPNGNKKFNATGTNGIIINHQYSFKKYLRDDNFIISISAFEVLRIIHACGAAAWWRSSDAPTQRFDVQVWRALRQA